MNHEEICALVNDQCIQKCLEIPGFAEVTGKPLPTVYVAISQEYSEQLLDTLVAMYTREGDVELNEIEFQAVVHDNTLIFLLNPLFHMVH